MDWWYMMTFANLQYNIYLRNCNTGPDRAWTINFQVYRSINWPCNHAPLAQNTKYLLDVYIFMSLSLLILRAPRWKSNKRKQPKQKTNCNSDVDNKRTDDTLLVMTAFLLLTTIDNYFF